MKSIFRSVLLSAAALQMICISNADEAMSSAELFVAYETVRPGERLPVAVKISVAEGWHTYAKEPGDSGMPPSITISGVDGLKVSDWRFPPPETFTDSTGTSYGYEHQVVLLGDVLIPETVPVNSTVELAVSMKWMICKDICVFKKRSQTVVVRSGTTSSEPSAEWEQLLEKNGWKKPLGLVPGKEP